MNQQTAPSVTEAFQAAAPQSSTYSNTTDGSRAARAGNRCQNESLPDTENEDISGDSLAATAAVRSRPPAASNATLGRRTRGHGTAAQNASEYADRGLHSWNTGHRPDVWLEIVSTSRNPTAVVWQSQTIAAPNVQIRARIQAQERATRSE